MKVIASAVLIFSSFSLSSAADDFTIADKAVELIPSNLLPVKSPERLAEYFKKAKLTKPVDEGRMGRVIRISIFYKTPSKLSVELFDDVTFAKDVVNTSRGVANGGYMTAFLFDASEVSDFIRHLDTYERWQATAKQANLAAGVEKAIGRIGEGELIFVSPDKLQIRSSSSDSWRAGSMILTAADASQLRTLGHQIPAMRQRILRTIAEQVSADGIAEKNKTDDAKKKALETKRADTLLK